MPTLISTFVKKTSVALITPSQIYLLSCSVLLTNMCTLTSHVIIPRFKALPSNKYEKTIFCGDERTR